VRLCVEKINDVRQFFSLRLPVDALNCQLLPAEICSDTVFCSDALMDFQLARSAHRLLLEGQLSAELRADCGRCLEPMQLSLREKFSLALNLVAATDVTDSNAVEDIALDEEQINTVPVVDGQVDLRPILQEQLLLHLPLHPVCDSECLGLCPQCGINLNREACHCRPLTFNRHFGQLKGLKII